MNIKSHIWFTGTTGMRICFPSAGEIDKHYDCYKIINKRQSVRFDYEYYLSNKGLFDTLVNNGSIVHTIGDTKTVNPKPRQYITTISNCGIQQSEIK